MARRRGAADGPASNALDLYPYRHWYVATAATGFSFFTLSTHMHENHLFLVIPVLALFAGWGRKWSWLYVIVTLSILTNLATHDLLLGEHVLSKIGGPTEFFSAPIASYKATGGDLTRTAYLSKLELGLSYVNSVVTLGAWATLMWWMARWLRRQTSTPDAVPADAD